jgi:hypothetical protein
MNRAYRYSFASHITVEDVEATLVLAVLAAESLHGESDVRLDAGHAFDAAARRCIIEAATPVGRDLCRLFTGFLRREFGDSAFGVERADFEVAAPTEQGVPAA